MWNNHIDERETKLWHPLWNNIEWLFPHTPVSESLLFLCTSLWLHQDNSAVQALCFSTWGHHSWQEMNTALISCLCLVWRCFIFRGEKATLSFQRINHFKIFQSDNHNSLHFTVFNKNIFTLPRQNTLFYLVTMAKLLISNLTWDYFTVVDKYLLVSVVWVYEAPTFLCGQMHCWVSFQNVPTPLWFPCCAEPLLWCRLGYTMANAVW